MSKKVYFLLMILSVLIACPFATGCSTHQSRMRDQRIEELERRVSKIEFEFTDTPSSSDGDYTRYVWQARETR